MKENICHDMDMEYERMIISPMDHPIETRKKLWHLLRELGIRYEYELY